MRYALTVPQTAIIKQSASSLTNSTASPNEVSRSEIIDEADDYHNKTAKYLIENGVNTDAHMIMLITRLCHPFVKLQTLYTSPIVNRELRANGDFLKTYELMIYLENEINDILKRTRSVTNGSDTTSPDTRDSDAIRLFTMTTDTIIPVLAIDTFLRKRGIELSWRTGGNELIYNEHGFYDNHSDISQTICRQTELLENHSERYEPLNILSSKELECFISKHKSSFDMFLSGGVLDIFEDIHLYKELNYNPLFMAHAIAAINTVDTNGIAILKALSFASYDSVFRVVLLSKYFKQIRIVKPYLSKFINHESFIICIGRNDKPFDEDIDWLLNYGSENKIDLNLFNSDAFEELYKVLRTFDVKRHSEIYDVVVDIHKHIVKNSWLTIVKKTKEPAKSIPTTLFCKLCKRYKTFYDDSVNVMKTFLPGDAD
jgi:hypothetical protein